MDFNESFRFNPQGLEALNAQLRQVVYAATEFPSVKEVQVLIEGKKVALPRDRGHPHRRPSLPRVIPEVARPAAHRGPAAPVHSRSRNRNSLLPFSSP